MLCFVVWIQKSQTWPATLNHLRRNTSIFHKLVFSGRILLISHGDMWKCIHRAVCVLQWQGHDNRTLSNLMVNMAVESAFTLGCKQGGTRKLKFTHVRWKTKWQKSQHRSKIGQIAEREGKTILGIKDFCNITCQFWKAYFHKTNTHIGDYW